MRIRLYVPQDAAVGREPGVAAVIRVPEIPDHRFPGKVTRIADALDPATRTLLTEIDVPNPDGELSPGIYCTVELRVPRRTPSLIVPARGDRLRPRRPPRLRGRERRRAQPQDHRNSRPRDRGRGQRRRQAGRRGRAHPARRPRRWRKSADPCAGCGQGCILIAAKEHRYGSLRAPPPQSMASEDTPRGRQAEGRRHYRQSDARLPERQPTPGHVPRRIVL